MHDLGAEAAVFRFFSQPDLRQKLEVLSKFLIESINDLHVHSNASLLPLPPSEILHSKHQTLISSVIVINKGCSSKLALVSGSTMLCAHCPREKFSLKICILEERGNPIKLAVYSLRRQKNNC